MALERRSKPCLYGLKPLILLGLIQVLIGTLTYAGVRWPEFNPAPILPPNRRAGHGAHPD
ncbi:hypothetical protein Sp245p_16290 (plasmid) [Azospirillum baldaniorum]|uniref:Uncharacterized protein n=1 Tax=Azospirillum baldaniorum TaxID=1064539 RepID=A0A9P1NNG0_9PROT|nr:hypothetical protein Sp245p_16290 [Azospirillum baldaniorum]CCC99688.1 protein of unknown function [Azospirillum baldaniorum]